MERDTHSPTDRLAVSIPAGRVNLSADVAIPPRCRGLVIFAHGSGSSRHSPRNRFVAGELNETGLGTVLIDLLTPDEEALDSRTAELRFDISLLGARLMAITDWISWQNRFAGLSLGYFGASTGGAAALVAAAERPTMVQAVVSRGGRPDLAGGALKHVLAPTLFIVGGEDHDVLRLNREAMEQLPSTTESRLAIIPGATHLFEEPGALDRVARLARSWLLKYLSPA